MFWSKKQTGGMSEGAIQSAVHAMELGAWAKYIKGFLFLLAIFVLILIYWSNQFRGLEMVEAMDAAQLARNIAKGEGFTTKFIRPVSAWKLSEVMGSAKLKERHPDLFNAPLYPYALATAFKLAGTKFEVKTVASAPYTKYPPETVIVGFCSALFLLSAGLVYFLAYRLFDKRIAFLSMLLFLLSDMLWRYSISGLPTMLLLFLFLCAQVCLVNAHLMASQEGKQVWLLGLLAATGLFCGLSLLTKYSAGWLILPVLAYVALVFGKQRWASVAVVAVVFLIVIAPWMVRNKRAVGNVFGLAGYSILEQTDRFPNDQFARQFKAINEPGARSAQKKFLINARNFAEEGWMKIGAGLAAVFFLAGLLYRFKKTEVLAYRRFVMGALVVAAFFSCFGSVASSSKDQAANPASIAVALCPGVIIMGVAFFYLLFDRVNLQTALLKKAAVVLFVIICSAPLIFSLLPPRRFMIRYPNPPYYEPVIAQIAKWVQPDELMVADIPWAVAWYGNRKAIWLPNTMEEFYQLNDYHARVAALLLCPMSIDRKFLTDSSRRNGDLRSWAPMLMGQVPQGFPLVARTPIPGLEPDQLFPDYLIFADRARWTEDKK